MSDNWAVQISVKIPHDNDNYRDTLVNIRAESGDQLEALLQYVEGKAAEIGSAVGTIRAAAGVGTTFAGPGTGTVQVQQEQPAQQGGWSNQGSQQSVPQQGAPAGPTPMCAHGPRQFKSGTSKSGKPYQAWFCPSRDRSNQCDPEWVRD